MTKKALLINPPIYDVQFWPEWSLPHGLLKIGSYLKHEGYETKLIDCLYSGVERRVPKKIKSVSQLCSTVEIPYKEFKKKQTRLNPDQRLKYIFGLSPDDLEKDLAYMAGYSEIGKSQGRVSWMPPLSPGFIPDEIWITSIMTYWWESTVDVVSLCKDLFPTAKIRIGGIYPTLASEHLKKKLLEREYKFNITLGIKFRLSDENDVIVVGEIPQASWYDLDFDLYYQSEFQKLRYYHGPSLGEDGYDITVADRRFYGPKYTILTTTRGCPFHCAYCAQRAYNLYDIDEVQKGVWTNENGKRIAVRTRCVEDVLSEIKDKFERYGIREFAFYEDNFLVEKEHFEAVLKGIISDDSLRGNIHLHAPEGIEVRLISDSLASLIKQAGFERVYLPLENINSEVIKSWNRSHSNVKMFERAVENCAQAGFVLRNMQINTFILFGTPGEDIRNVVDSALYAAKHTGSVIPMLFTPVPGSDLFYEYEDYLFNEMKFDLHHLNGKLLPFLKFNQRIYPELTFQDYLDLEGIMFRLNAQATRGTFNLGANTNVSKTFCEILSAERL